MSNFSLDQLSFVEHVSNPGVPVVKTSKGLVVHNRDDQTWVITQKYDKPESSKILKNNYSLIERTCDCVEFIIYFGVKPLISDFYYRIRDHFS